MTRTDPQIHDEEPRWVAGIPEPQRTRVREGRSRTDPRRFGVLAPVIGGIVFVNAGLAELDLSWGWVLRAVAILLAVACVLQLFLRPAALGGPERMHWSAIAIWLAGIVFMIVGVRIAGGAADAAGMEYLRPAINAAFVGAHFIPYAWAFSTRMIIPLGIGVALIGVLGVVAGIVAGPPWPAVAAILAGLVQMSIVLVWASGRILGPPPRPGSPRA